MKQPLISVIIPVYNRECYIKEALDSVLIEDYPNKEIVVIDDGSTDQSKTVIECWMALHQETIPVVFVSRSNRGFIPTLNELITLSHGDYIVFFGSDDRLENNGIAKRLAYLEAHPDKLMVVGDCRLIDGDGRLLHASAYEGIGRADKQMLLTDAGLRKYMILNGFVPGATLMADKRIYGEFGLYDETLHAEDWVYYIRVVAKNKLGFINETVASYRRHDDNMSFSSIQLTHAKEQFQMLLKMFFEFKGVDRLYVIQRLLFACLYIPYLWLKFKLIRIQDEAGSSDQPMLLNRLSKQALKFILFLKQLFMHACGKRFARL